MLLPSDPNPPADPRRALRQRLRSARDAFVADAAGAHAALAAQLSLALGELQPAQLGVYWALESEFNAAAACCGDKTLASIQLALPYARRAAHTMDYRAWDRDEPTLRDECAIPACAGEVVVPEVVLVPCVGFTASGHRLGYGGGYFDRWLALHPYVTAVGVAWSVSQLDEGELGPQPHDHPLMVVVTERGIVGGG
jgi:5,10-methenyltetrahydrofolate synthetase